MVRVRPTTLGHFTKGNLQLRPNAWWSWSDTHPDRRAFVFRDYPGGWSDSNEQRNAVLVRSAPPDCHDQFGSLRRRSIDTAIFAPAISDRKIRFPGNRE